MAALDTTPPDAPHSYAVWKLKFRLTIQDPHTAGPRYHTTTLFVETEPSAGTGVEHHVTGDVASAGGMRYESRPMAGRPEESDTFHSRELLGHTAAAQAHSGAWQEVLARVPPPPQQKAFNVATMATEPFRSLRPLAFYAPGESRPPLFKCTEWVELRAVPALVEAGLLRRRWEEGREAW